MEQVIHIAPVGHTVATIVESIRRHPASAVILVLGNQPDYEGEKTARLKAAEIKRELGSIPCTEYHVDPVDISSAALDIIRLIRKEQGKDRKVMINLSGSLRTIGIAAYIAAQATRTEAYIGVPAFADGKLVGISSVAKVPLPALKQLSATKEKMLMVLSGGELALDDLLKQMWPKMKKSSKQYLSEKSKLSHHIKDLKEDGYLTAEREGKTLKIRITKLGEIYVEGILQKA